MIVKNEPTHELMNLYMETFVQQAEIVMKNLIALRMTVDGPET